MELEWSASDILARLKAGLKNEDTRIEGSFSMDNMQAVSEELARYNSMLIKPLWDEIDLRIDEVITSGNENHYAFWARQVENAEGKRVIGSARVHGVRDGSGIVHVALLTPEAGAPTQMWWSWSGPTLRPRGRWERSRSSVQLRQWK